MINLDPANDAVPYEAAVDLNELITIDDVMQEFGLGPNGGAALNAALLATQQPFLTVLMII